MSRVGSPTMARRGRSAPSSTSLRAPRQPTSSSAVKTSCSGAAGVREAAWSMAARKALVSAAPRPKTFPSRSSGASAKGQAGLNGTQSVWPTSASPPRSEPRWQTRFALATPASSVHSMRRAENPSERACRSRTSSRGALLRAEVESTATSSRSSATAFIPTASASRRGTAGARRRRRARGRSPAPPPPGWPAPPCTKPRPPPAPPRSPPAFAGERVELRAQPAYPGALRVEPRALQLDEAEVVLELARALQRIKLPLAVAPHAEPRARREQLVGAHHAVAQVALGGGAGTDRGARAAQGGDVVRAQMDGVHRGGGLAPSAQPF